MPEPPDPFYDATDLGARTREIGAQFLFTELQSAHAMMDAAESSEDAESNERRRALARRALDVVANHLTVPDRDTLALSDAVRAELARLHADLAKRLGP